MKSTLRFLIAFSAIFIASFAICNFIDHSFELNGQLAKYAFVPPAIKLAVQFWPDRLLVNIPKNAAYDLAFTQVFAKEMEDNFFKDNTFLSRSVSDNELIVSAGGAYRVVRGVAGSKPNAARNREQYPKPVVNRKDDSNDYDLTHISTEVDVIHSFEEFVTSYSKRASVLMNHANTIREDQAEIALDIWHPNGADNIIRTSGSNKDSGPGQTGNRKQFTRADFVKVAEVFNRMSVPQSGRNILIPANLFSDILNIDGFVEADKIGSPVLIEGFIGRLLGFDIFTRETVGVYDNTSTPIFKPSGSELATADNLACLAWHSNHVYRAEGPLMPSVEENVTQYDGSLFSAQAWFGAQKRKDLKGIVAIVQSH